MARLPPNTDPPFPPAPKQPSGGTKSSTLGGSPGLLTSTGGLFGVNGILLTPVFNNITQESYLIIMDSSNFNCDEDAEYDYPQVLPLEQEGRNVTCHLIILKYRELGLASFTINITVYQQTTDTFITQSYKVNIASKRSTFPDKRIHTKQIPIDITGERPQVTVTYKANSGPLSITKLILCGNADETPQQ